MRVASTDDVEVVVHDLGGHGPPLLFVHATGFHGRCWGPVADRLPDWHSLAVDLRGHGDSRVPPDHGFDWQGFADDVLAVVDALELVDPVGAGHSKGGASLLLAEQRRPGTFRAIWCFEPVVFPGPPPAGASRANPLAAGARRRRDVFASHQDAFDNFRGKPPLNGLTDESLWAYVSGGFTEEPDQSVRLKCRPEHEARVYEMGSQHEAFAHLTEVQCPVTVVRARLEPGPAAFAERIADRLPRGRLELMDHLGHFGPMEAPEEIARSIERALAPP